MPTRPPLAVFALLLLLPASVWGQEKPCTSSDHRSFDFWLGSWDVRAPDGSTAGHNDVTSEMGGCVVHEHWEGAGGSRGESFNVFDARRGVWHQTWVDNGGGLLLLDGRYADGKMVLRGEQPGRDGGTVVNRITWSRVGGDPDRVRQLWEASRDGGATWSVVFDGLYMRVAAGPGR